MRPPLFILSSGRSGSTLLQRILNTWDDIVIWGEHGGFLRDTAAAYFRLLESPGIRKSVFPVTAGEPVSSRDDVRRCKDPARWQAWTNFFTEGDVRESFRRHVESFFRHPAVGEDHVWGFKEIRYGADDRVVEFLSTLYPEAIFVFLSRSVYDTVSSQMRAFNGASGLAAKLPTREFCRLCRRWRDQNQSLLNWHRSGRLQSFWLKFEDLSASLEALEPVARAVGESLGPDQEAVLQMPEGRGAAFKGSGDVNERWKTMSAPQLLAVRWIAGRLNQELGHAPPRPAIAPEPPPAAAPAVRTDRVTTTT